MNIFTFEESSHQSPRSPDDDDDDKPHLNPRDVLQLAATLPDCRQLSIPPAANVGSSPPSIASTLSPLSIESGVLTSLRKRIEEQFGKEQVSSSSSSSDCLSFLVTDDSGEAARIDVYCRSGTVCIVRVLPNTAAEAAVELHDKDNAGTKRDDPSIQSSSLSPSNMLASYLSLSETTTSFSPTSSCSPVPPSQSRENTASKNKNPTLITANTHQLRRIFRRKVTLEKLHRILLHPPIMNSVSLDMIQIKNSNNDNTNSDTTTTTTTTTGGEEEMNLYGLSLDQQQFLQQECKKYNRRIQQEERIRRKMAQFILSGSSADDFLSIESKDTIDGSIDSSTDNNTATNLISEYRMKQTEIERKIELADMGLAILTGELESIEKMMEMVRVERGDVEEEDSDGERVIVEEESVRNRHPREGNKKKKQKQHRGREGKKSLTWMSGDSSESIDSKRLPIHEGESSDDSSTLDDSEAEEIARMLQGCEIEYSFPFEFHEELEDALLGQEFASEFDNDLYGDDTTCESKPACRGRTRRCKDERFGHSMEIPTILAVPTNGHGCIVLRNNGAFSVIGILPRALYKSLFRKRAPYPEYIALGTKGRYYVRFEDGTTECAGPSALKAFLNKNRNNSGKKAKSASRFSRNGIISKKMKRGEIDKRRRSPSSITSIAFGKRFDDFFLVRNDGSWECNGDMPRSLDKLLEDRGDRADLEWVALGPNGEWCLKAQNEKIWWGGVSEEADDHLSRVLIEEDEEKEMTNDLKFVDFGVNGAFFLLYQ